MTYDAARHFADSWGLLFMCLAFLTMIGWALRPNGRKHYDQAAHSIFEEDEASLLKDKAGRTDRSGAAEGWHNDHQ